MLVKDESKFCYIVNGNASFPKNSLKEAIQDYLDEAKKNNYSLDCVDIVNPYIFIPEISGKDIIYKFINNVPELMFNSIDENIGQCYLPYIPSEHLDELGKEVSKVFSDWEKRHGYDNQSYIIINTEAKTYFIPDCIK